MRIEFQRSGGIAGAILRSEVDTRDLPEGQSREFEQMLAGVDLGAIKSRISQHGSGSSRGADRFQYDLVVEQEGQRNHLTFSDGALPAELSPLVDRMQELAHRR